MKLGWILVKGEKSYKDFWKNLNMDLVSHKKLLIFLGELRYYGYVGGYPSYIIPCYSSGGRGIGGIVLASPEKFVEKQKVRFLF